MTAKTSGVSIIIPAYNEQNGIGDVLTALIEQLGQTKLVHEIIVVDDGSKDNTAKVIADHNTIKLIQHRQNQGYGAALKTGIRNAQHDVICITDADGTYPNERIVELVHHLTENNLDMVVGARTGDNVAIPLIRRPAKWVIGQLANLVAGQTIPDINSGLRVFRKQVCLRFFNLLPNGFSFTTTITLGMMTNAYQVDYIPINYHMRVGKSKIKPIRDTLNFVQLILRMALYFAPLKVFMPASIVLILTGIGWGVFSLTILDQFADVSTLLLVLTGIQIGMVGLLAELINRRVPNEYR